jgi:CDP-diacylglycerol---serine O-phosphatidyltransferase
MILYQLLRIGFAQQEAGLDVSFAWLLPAFIYTGAVAWRLAKFNISTDQTDSFRGVPSPAAGLVVASFPLIVFYQYFNVHLVLINPWVLYAVIIILSYLMVCNKEFMAIKFKDFSFKNNGVKYILFAISIVLIVLLKWLAVPAIFVLYLVMSLVTKTPGTVIVKSHELKETKDITV